MTEEKSDTIAKNDNVALLQPREPGVDNTRVSFLTSEDEEARIRMALDRGVFIGFTKEELLKFERDPGWKKMRVGLLVCFWLAWALLLLAAIVVIIFTPACPGRPLLQWPEKFPIYEINVPSFRIGSRCSSSPSSSVGNVDGVIDVITSGSSNYFDRIQPADIFWLRGIYKPQTATEGPTLDPIAGANLGKLFEVTKKKQRRILLDLLPYKVEPKISSALKNLECGLFSGSSVREAEESKDFVCLDQDSDVDKMIAFINANRNDANGFVLGYSHWLLNTTSSSPLVKSPLERIVEAVARGLSGEAASGDNAKHLFMRFPILDSRYVSGSSKDELIERRIREEEVARKAGIRVIIETIAMNSGDPNACYTVECLSRLVEVVQGFSNRTAAYRAFAIDDPLLKGRAAAGDQWKSTEALAAFTIAALPGTPVIFYGSEIGMSSTSTSTEIMQWTDLRNNTCLDSSLMCFCNVICQGANGPTNRTCPVDQPAEHPLNSVREQVRTESSGPLKSFVQLLFARQNNDSLSWGKSHVIVDKTRPTSQKFLVAIRQADQFDRFGLFVSLGSSSKDTEAVPHVPDELANECYQTVYSFSNGKTSASSQKQRFSNMVMQKDEVRLVRVFKTCGAASLKALSWSMVIVLLAVLYNNFPWI